MLAKCANPSCSTPFRYLNEGRMFYVHLDGSSAGLEGAARQVEHYWLCEACARDLRVVSFHGGVALQFREGLPAAAHPPSVILLKTPQPA